MQKRTPQPRRCHRILRRCPITVRPPSLPALLTCVLTPFEKLAWLGGYHRDCLPQPGNSLLYKGRQTFLVTHQPSNMCSRRCRRSMYAHMHVLGQGSVPYIHTYIHTHIHTHPYTHTYFGQHHDADQLHWSVHPQKPTYWNSCRSSPPSWSYDIKPRIATLTSERQTHSVRHPAPTLCLWGPLPSPLLRLALALSLYLSLFSSALPHPLFDDDVVPAHRQDAPCLSDR